MGVALKLPEPKWKREPSRPHLAKNVLESTIGQRVYDDEVRGT